MPRLCSESSRSYPGRSAGHAAPLSSAVAGNGHGDLAEVSRRHSRCRTPMMIAHRLETSREIPRGNRGGLTPLKDRTLKQGRSLNELAGHDESDQRSAHAACH